MARGRPTTPPGDWGEIQTYERDDGKWVAQGRVRLYTGQTRQIKMTRAKKGEAITAFKDRAKSLTATVTAGDINNASRVLDLVDYWHAQHDVRPSSLATYRKVIDKHITPALGQLHLYELTTPIVQRFLDGLTPGTAQTARAVLSSAFNLATRLGVTTTDPVVATRLKRRQKKEINALTDSEIAEYRQRIIDWSGGNKLGRPRGEGLLEIIDALIGTGLRIGEALALNWEDVDQDAGTVTVVSTVDNKGGRTDLPKNDSSRRTIHAAPIALEALRRQWDKEYRPVLAPIVFPTTTGTYRSVPNTEARLRSARGDLKIVPHDFRKTISTRIEQSHGMLAASRHLGHANTTVTESAYLARPEVVPNYFETEPGAGG